MRQKPGFSIFRCRKKKPCMILNRRIGLWSTILRRGLGWGSGKSNYASASANGKCARLFFGLIWNYDLIRQHYHIGNPRQDESTDHSRELQMTFRWHLAIATFHFSARFPLVNRERNHHRWVGDVHYLRCVFCFDMSRKVTWERSKCLTSDY